MEKVKVFRLKIALFPDKEFDKKFGAGTLAHWEDYPPMIALRKSRTGLNRLSDWLHECRHLWVDLLEEED